MKYLLSILLFVSLVSNRAMAGEHPKAATRTVMISGKVQDLKNNETLAGVKIECEASQKAIYTDLEGRFFIYLKVESTQNIKIEFTQVGYATKTLSLQDISANPGTLEINLEEE